MPDTKHAMLNSEGVLTGYSDMPGEKTIEVESECDLEPHKYRWDGEKFIPIPSQFLKTPMTADPDNLIAIALAIRAFGRVVDLPEYTKAWLRTFAKYPDDLAPPKVGR